jgi:hypothetical protein
MVGAPSQLGEAGCDRCGETGGLLLWCWGGTIIGGANTLKGPGARMYAGHGPGQAAQAPEDCQPGGGGEKVLVGGRALLHEVGGGRTA